MAFVAGAGIDGVARKKRLTAYGEPNPPQWFPLAESRSHVHVVRG
jgi:hypothetical protein